MDQQRSRRLGSNLMWIHLLISVESGFVVLGKALGVAGCEDRCDYSTLDVVIRGFWVADIIILIVVAGAYFLTVSRWSRAWMVPALGMLVTLVAFFITMVIAGNAMVVG